MLGTAQGRKRIIGVDELTYLGFRISKGGCSLDPEMTRPVLDFLSPTSCNEVYPFLGMVQYYGFFIPNLSMVASPLYEFTKKKY
ncbi:unnamed protein product [Lepeophtheirus salmonis]|uniref:(salmon louse) hypothetical protein n=1 Tax=Lepeophtheirus salmonis TaxID=72036 RepID=A0A7R8CHX2_LEPSM|nr:unnamed protein product [Lepeophtheirus salmonis]CAF2827246.1 unnamed protein product [Lepeophtheirus salmonis]